MMRWFGLLTRGAALVLCGAVLCCALSCMKLPSSTTTPAPTTPVPTQPPLSEDALAACRALALALDGFSPSRVQTAVRYDSPAVGAPLSAETTLAVSGGELRLTYSYDKLNPIGSESFTSRQSGELLGTAQELRDEIGALHLFGIESSGVLLLELAPVGECFSLASAENGRFTAKVKDACIADVFGGSLGGARDVSLSAVFSETAVSQISLSYLLGDAAVTVEMSFS